MGPSETSRDRHAQIGGYAIIETRPIIGPSVGYGVSAVVTVRPGVSVKMPLCDTRVISRRSNTQNAATAG